MGWGPGCFCRCSFSSGRYSAFCCAFAARLQLALQSIFPASSNRAAGCQPPGGQQSHDEPRGFRHLGPIRLCTLEGSFEDLGPYHKDPTMKGALYRSPIFRKPLYAGTSQVQAVSVTGLQLYGPKRAESRRCGVARVAKLITGCAAKISESEIRGILQDTGKPSLGLACFPSRF